MEFEKNKPTTLEDVELADTPHVTLRPSHEDIRPDITNTPNVARPDNRNFEFETESTAETALSTGTRSRHPHHTLALVLTVTTVVLFVTALAVLYLIR